MKYPIIKQHDQKDCGAACLSMIASFYGLKLPLVKCRELIKVDTDGANLFALIQGASKIGLSAEDKADFVPAYIEEGQQYLEEGTYSLPFSKSTEILLYNKTLLNGIIFFI